MNTKDQCCEKCNVPVLGMNGTYFRCATSQCPCHTPHTDSELIEEVEKRIHAREMDIRQIGEHLGCNEDELMNEMAQMLRWDYIALLTTTIARVRQQYHHELSALIEGDKTYNRPKQYDGNDLNSACDAYGCAFTNWEEVIRYENGHDAALDRIKALSEGMVGDKEKLCPNCGVDTRKYPHKNCVISSCDCHINLEKGKHWPGCVHYKKE